MRRPSGSDDITRCRRGDVHGPGGTDSYRRASIIRRTSESEARCCARKWFEPWISTCATNAVNLRHPVQKWTSSPQFLQMVSFDWYPVDRLVHVFQRTTAQVENCSNQSHSRRISFFWKERLFNCNNAIARALQLPRRAPVLADV